MATSEVTNKLIQLKDTNGNPLYPKVLSKSIPDGSVTKAQLDDEVKQKIDGIVITLNYSGHPGEYEIGESSLSSFSDLETYYNAYQQGVNIYFVINSTMHGHGFNTSSTNYLPVYEFGYSSRSGYTLKAKDDLFIYTANSINESPYLTVTTSAITIEPKDRSVTTIKIANKAVTKEKLSNDVLEDITSITWHELKQLRDGNNLLPGHQYRITDYQCTTTQENTQSAGHQFDIIVIADSTNKLNEKARACLHDGDTYFQNSNLAAWQLWYCLDNDTNRFVWADNSLGHGIIYRMIDEWNNDCPYDFKNIQFKRYKITSSKSSSLVGTYLATETISRIDLEVDDNDYKMFYTFSYLGDLPESNTYSGEILEDASILGNTLELQSEDNMHGVRNNNIKYYIDINSEGSEPVQILNNIVFLTYRHIVYYGCYSNSFNVNCFKNSFGNFCSNNSLLGSCFKNSFGDFCRNNSFGQDCNCNTFGIDCTCNSLGIKCYNNSLNDSCTDNSFGNRCSYNSFGNECCNNSFSDGSSDNTFSNSCSNNSFGVSCSYNSFNNNCTDNSFGNYCFNNKLNIYYNQNTFDNGVSSVIFNGDGTGSKYIQNYHIKQSMVFDEGSEYTITAKPGLTYMLSVGKKSDGTVVEYNEADTHKLVSITDQDYAALTTKDSNTVYCIPEQ